MTFFRKPGPRVLAPLPSSQPWPTSVVYDLPGRVYDHLVEVCRRWDQTRERKPMVSLFNGESQAVVITILDLKTCGRMEFPSAVYPPGSDFYGYALTVPTIRELLLDTGYTE